MEILLYKDKNKNSNTHSVTFVYPDSRGERQCSKMDTITMTDKNSHLVTGGIFYFRDSAGFSVSVFNKLMCNLTGKFLEIGN